MPWHKESDNSECDGIAVVRDSDGHVEGCHTGTDEEANNKADAQMAALYASEETDVAKASETFYKRFLDFVMPHIPAHIWQEWQRKARGHAGGKAPRKPKVEHDQGDLEKASPEIGPDELSRRVRESFDVQFTRSRMSTPVHEARLWIKEVLSDHVVVEAPEGLFAYPFVETDGGYGFGERYKVEREYKRVEKAFYVPFVKADEEKRLVYGIVMEPDTIDSQGDAVTKEEIEATCHRYMIRSQQLDVQHQRTLAHKEASVVESYIAPTATMWTTPGGQQLVKEGSWVMVTKIFNDEIWGAVKSGELTGYSIRGLGVRERRAA